jgi:hypothetical protein
MAPELAGPQQEELVAMARAVIRARGGRRVVLPLRLPGATGRALVDGSLLPTGAGPRGRQTFAE